ncbi:hypothetical protein EDC01DRAFT_671765 [Geopyxis carbonaria]|nr:hypothetical protein EDC01DRAFT_671765 [Geopyxis carbonaria]
MRLKYLSLLANITSHLLANKLHGPEIRSLILTTRHRPAKSDPRGQVSVCRWMQVKVRLFYGVKFISINSYPMCASEPTT